MTSQKTNIPGLSRDSRTGALVAHDTSEYERLLALRREVREREDVLARLDALERRVRELEETK